MDKKTKQKRRGRGEGSISKRKSDGLWMAVVDLGFNSDGKRLRKTVYGKTRKEAHDKLQGLLDDKRQGTIASPSKMTVWEYVSEWLASPARDWRDSTRTVYTDVATGNIKTTIGGVKLTKLTPMHVDRLYRNLERAGKPSTANQVHKILNQAMARAVKYRLISFNPCRDVDKPVYRSPEVETWTAEEAEGFLMAIKEDRLYALYLMGIATGMRQGELLALRWENVDLDRHELFVKMTARRDGGVSTPKTPKSKRRISLPESLVDALHDHRKQSVREGNGASPWVFCAPRGGRMWSQQLTNRFFPVALKAAGLPPIRFHAAMRHCHATMLLEDNVHPSIVASRLGHSSTRMTDRYSHVHPTMDERAAATMETRFKSLKTG